MIMLKSRTGDSDKKEADKVWNEDIWKTPSIISIKTCAMADWIFKVEGLIFVISPKPKDWFDLINSQHFDSHKIDPSFLLSEPTAGFVVEIFDDEGLNARFEHTFSKMATREELEEFATSFIEECL